MQLDTELRQTLWNARRWEQVLCERAIALRQRSISPQLAAPARALAFALEEVVLDRRHAIEMYLLASKAAGADVSALARARSLAREIGELALVARIAGLERKHGGDSALALVEGQAWLDAGDPDRAIKPLIAAARADPGDVAATRALCAARREWADVRGEIDRLEAAGAAADDGAAAALDFLHASRIARMLGDEARAGELVAQAFARDPANDAAYGLVERELVSSRQWDRLLEVYRLRCDVATTEAEVVDTLRRGATRMSVTDGAPALAVTVAVRALGYAYDQGVIEIPGHLAMLDILCRHYIRARSAEQVLPVIDRGMDAGLPDDDVAALSIAGLDVAWTHLGSATSAQRYAGWVEARAPENPVLAEYKRRGGSVTGILRGDGDEPVAGDRGDGDEPALPETLELDDDGGWLGGGDEAPAEAAPSPDPLGVDAASLANRGEVGVARAGDAEIGDVLDLAAVSEAGGEPAAIDAPPVAPGAASPPPSPVPPQSTPPAPGADEMDEMIELDPDDLEEIGDEAATGIDASAVADPGEGSTDVSGPIPAPEMAPPPAPAPAAKRPLGGGGSLIPGAAKKALDDIVRAPAGPPARGPEQRAHERYGLPGDVTVAVSANVVLGGGKARGVTRDISRTGAFIVTDALLPRDVAFELELSLPTSDGFKLGEYALRAVVVREEAGVGYGVRFEDPGAAYQQAVLKLGDRQRG